MNYVIRTVWIVACAGLICGTYVFVKDFRALQHRLASVEQFAQSADRYAAVADQYVREQQQLIEQQQHVVRIATQLFEDRQQCEQASHEVETFRQELSALNARTAALEKKLKQRRGE